MTSDQFAIWLEGFLAGAGKALTVEQVEAVRTKLAGVVKFTFSPAIAPFLWPMTPPDPTPQPWVNPVIYKFWTGDSTACPAPVQTTIWGAGVNSSTLDLNGFQVAGGLLP